MQAVLLMTVELGLAICGRFIGQNNLYNSLICMSTQLSEILVFVHKASGRNYLNTVAISDLQISPIFPRSISQWDINVCSSIGR